MPTTRGALRTSLSAQDPHSFAALYNELWSQARTWEAFVAEYVTASFELPWHAMRRRLRNVRSLLDMSMFQLRMASGAEAACPVAAAVWRTERLLGVRERRAGVVLTAAVLAHLWRPGGVYAEREGRRACALLGGA